MEYMALKNNPQPDIFMIRIALSFYSIAPDLVRLVMEAYSSHEWEWIEPNAYVAPGRRAGKGRARRSGNFSARDWRRRGGLPLARMSASRSGADWRRRAGRR